MALDAADNIASGTVTISKGALQNVLPITITEHAGSVTFSGIQVGTWQLLVQLFDGEGVEIYTGTGSALVTPNHTTTVTVSVNHNTGTLIINVEVPVPEYVDDQLPDVELGGFRNPMAVFSDGIRLCVADVPNIYGSGGILIYEPVPTDNAASPNIILPGSDFICVNSAGGKFFATCNNTVRIYNSFPTSSSASPDVVLGGFHGPEPYHDGGPYGVCSDGVRMYVSDTWHGQVLIYNTIPTSDTAVPDVVLGGFNLPWGISCHDAHLCVSDARNNRVVIFNTIPTSNSATPDVIVSANYPNQLCYDGQRLFVAETAGGYISIYNTIPDNNSATPDVTITGGFNWPDGVYSDGQRMIIADRYNYRVLIYYPH